MPKAFLYNEIAILLTTLIKVTYLLCANMNSNYAKLADAKSQLANEAKNTSTNLARALR